MALRHEAIGDKPPISLQNSGGAARQPRETLRKLPLRRPDKWEQTSVD